MGIYEGTSSLPDTPGAISDAESKRRWFEQNDFDARSAAGESLRDMKCRFLAFIARTIEIRVGTPGIILMITHGGILNAVLPFVFENLDPVSCSPFFESLGHWGNRFRHRYVIFANHAGRCQSGENRFFRLSMREDFPARAFLSRRRGSPSRGLVRG